MDEFDGLIPKPSVFRSEKVIPDQEELLKTVKAPSAREEIGINVKSTKNAEEPYYYQDEDDDNSTMSQEEAEMAAEKEQLYLDQGEVPAEENLVNVVPASELKPTVIRPYSASGTNNPSMMWAWIGFVVLLFILATTTGVYFYYKSRSQVSVPSVPSVPAVPRNISMFDDSQK